MFGYTGKLLFVNLSTGEIEVRPLDEDVARNFIGGPALGAKILYDEMPAKADPFGEESMIGFVTGPLNDTPAFYGGRYTVVSKSPVTGGWNDANSGGFFGPYLKKAGFDAVFVKGKSDKPVYIMIDNGNVEIKDAEHIWGLTTLPTEEALKKEHGDEINAALIGPGGENLSLIAAVMNDGHRAAGRGGSGAVMGSKKLKAVVVKGDFKTPIFNREKLTEINKSVSEYMKGPRAAGVASMGSYGTGGGYVNSVLASDASIKNWSGSFLDYPEEAAYPVGSLGIDKWKTRQYRCASCPLGCGAFHNVPSKRWDLSDSPRPEYETQGAFGSQLLNGDVESVFRANDLCNEYGIDTISTGATVGWAMECYENGVLSKEELDGIELNWGNGDAIVAMTEKIGKNEGVGKILALGSKKAAEHFGKGFEYLVVASGIEEPQHDSRLSYGLARTYQYDPTPGRHVKGGLGLGLTYRHNTGHNLDYRGTGYADMMGVVNREIQNSSGFCMFGGLNVPAGSVMGMITAVTGFNYSKADELALGQRMYTIRHAFNLREGMRRADFSLSKRMIEADPPTQGPIAGIKVNNELLADNFFNTMGWTMDAVPSKEALSNLGAMENIIEDLYPAGN